MYYTCIHVTVDLNGIISVNLTVRVDEVESGLSIWILSFDLVARTRQEISAITRNYGVLPAQMIAINVSSRG